MVEEKVIHPKKIENNTFKDILLEEDEVVIATLKKGPIDNLVFDNMLLKNFVILTQKRLYYSGQNIEIGSSMKKESGFCVLPLEHISSISYYDSSKPLLLMFAILSGLFGFYMSDAAGSAYILFGIIPAVFLYFMYKSSLYSGISISTVTASVVIDFKVYGRDKLKAFLKAVGHAMTKSKTGKN